MRGVFAAIALLVLAACAPTVPVTTFDGEYTGTAKWVQCPSAGHLNMLVENGNVRMIANRATRLTFAGPVNADGTVSLHGTNNTGYSGMMLIGRFSGDQFDGRSSGLRCDFVVSMVKRPS